MSEQTLTSDQAAAGTTYPAAGLERRFHAFTLDRLVAWALDAAGIAAAYLLLVERGRTAAGVAAMVGTVLLVSLAYAVLLGLRGTSPGRAAVGLRVVDATTGTPIGVGRALLRTAVLGVATLPTFGLGVATLAWTAVMDVGARRRGWHDHLARSVVVDVRPAPVEVVEEAPAPRAIVNLTAMRLAPRAQTPPDSAPRAVARPEAPAPVARPAPEAAPDVAPEAAPAPEPEPVPVPAPPAPAPAEPRHAAQESASLDTATSPARTRRRRLGYPLVGQPPAGPPASPPPSGPPSTPPPPTTPPPPPTTAPPTVPPAVPPPVARWRVAFDTGESFEVTGLTLVGRRPEGRPGEPVHRLVPLHSEDLSLSKTHAQFQVVPDGALVVMDRGSTNGSVLIRRGVPRHLTGGRPSTLLDGDVVRFGDRTMTVARESSG